MPRPRSIPGVADVDLPWEKLRRQGPEACQNHELLAVVLEKGYGSTNVLDHAEAILQRHSLDELMDMAPAQLSRVKGISAKQSLVLTACLEIARRALRQGMGIMPCISKPTDIIPLIADIREKCKEHFVAIFLNARNQVIHRENVSVGSLNASLVHPREVFSPAVGSSAAGLILAHNHPSGDVTPSREDIDLTKRMVQAGEIMGIEVLDHLVLAPERFLSMREANLL